LYRISCHGLAAVLFPAALFLIVGGQAAVFAWTQDAEVARSVAPLLRWLAAGAALHSVMFATYAFSQAVGLERLVLRINVQALLVSLPLTWLLASLRGAEGAAQAWFLSHAAYFAASAWQTHRRALPNEALRWLVADIGVPALACFVIGCLVTAFVPMPSLGTIAQLALGICAAGSAFALTLLASSRLRELVRRLVGKRRTSASALL
jgi:O-antigen/teichoic acid export membrane protein